MDNKFHFVIFGCEFHFSNGRKPKPAALFPNNSNALQNAIYEMCVAGMVIRFVIHFSSVQCSYCYYPLRSYLSGSMTMKGVPKSAICRQIARKLLHMHAHTCSVAIYATKCYISCTQIAIIYGEIWKPFHSQL